MSRADVEVIINHMLPNLPGWCTPEKGRRMAELSYGAALCVELGVFGGRALVAMALALRDQGSGQAFGVDPYTVVASLEGTNDPANDVWWGQLNYDGIMQAAQNAINMLGLSGVAHLVRCTSREAAMMYGDGAIDVLHQDSNHSEEVSCEEVALWTPKLRPGGYWIFDDTNWPTTQKAQGLLVEHEFEQLEDHETWKVYRRVKVPSTP